MDTETAHRLGRQIEATRNEIAELRTADSESLSTQEQLDLLAELTDTFFTQLKDHLEHKGQYTVVRVFIPGVDEQTGLHLEIEHTKFDEGLAARWYLPAETTPETSGDQITAEHTSRRRIELPGEDSSRILELIGESIQAAIEQTEADSIK